MSRPQVDVLIATQLAANVSGLVYNATGANVFTGLVRGVDQPGIPVNVVFVEQRDKRPRPYLAAQISGSQYPSDIIVRVRGGPMTFTSTKELAEQCFDALHLKPPAGLIDCRGADGPSSIGPDQNGNFEWVMHFDALWVGLP